MNPVTPPDGEPRRTLRLAVVEGCFTAAHVRVCTGPLLTAAALALGARDLHLGLLSAFAAVATAGGLITALALPHLGERRRLAALATLAGRGAWLFPAALLLTGGGSGPLKAFLALALVTGVAIQMGVTAWQSWITDLVPPERRGRYFALRNTVVGTVDMLVAYGTGLFYDHLKAAGREPQALALLFAAAAVAGIVAAILYLRQWEPPMRAEEAGPAGAKLLLPLRAPSFRRLLLYSAGWSAAISLAGPFYVAHMIRNLHMPMAVIAWYSILAGVANLLSQTVWGRVTDRVGNRPVLVATMTGIVFLPLLWLPATPDRTMLIWVDAVLTGMLYPGFSLALFNLVLGTAPQENRSAYFAVHSLATGTAAFAGGLLGGAFAEHLRSWSITVAGLTLVNFHVLFILTSAARLTLVPLALRLNEERAAPMTALIDLFVDKLSQTSLAGLRAGVVLIRRLTPGRRDEQDPS